jgi:SAM-dependent methyltransferase
MDSLAQDVRFVGIDSSDAMLARADAALASSMRHPYELRRADLNDGLRLDNASVVIMSLTLQFVRPLYRQRVLAEIYAGLNPDGCLLLIEKVGVEESLLNRLYIDHYYEFKRRNGYSRTEIARKREALENVLIPYRLTENERCYAMPDSAPSTPSLNGTTSPVSSPSNSEARSSTALRAYGTFVFRYRDYLVPAALLLIVLFTHPLPWRADARADAVLTRSGPASRSRVRACACW